MSEKNPLYSGVELKTRHDEMEEKKAEEEKNKKYFNGFENMLKNFPNEFENVSPEKSFKEEINLLKQRIKSIEEEVDKLKKKSNKKSNKKTTKKVKKDKKDKKKGKNSNSNSSSS